MQYQVRIIGDNELPDEVNWAFVRVDGSLRFLLKQSVGDDPERLETTLEEAWWTYRRIAQHELMSWSEVVVECRAGA